MSHVYYLTLDYFFVFCGISRQTANSLVMVFMFYSMVGVCKMTQCSTVQYVGYKQVM